MGDKNMYDGWLYDHFINTNWFLFTLLSLPCMFALYIAYKGYNLSREQGQQASPDKESKGGGN